VLKKEGKFYFLAIVSGFLISILLVLCFVFLGQFSEKKALEEQTEKSAKTPLLSFEKFSPGVLTLEQIFSKDHDWIATLSARRVRTLIATGDVIPARSVNFRAHQYQNFKWPFEKTASVLKSADITLINLESPLVSGCPLTNSGMIFCGDPENVQGLVFAGVDVASLANNHLENQGVKGVESTISILEEKDILATGISGPVFKNVGGLRLAFLGYNDVDGGQVISLAREEKIASEIKEARQEADLIVVSFHWGEEYRSSPTQRQKELAHLAVDSGADLVVGNHPHWLQPVEIYKEKIIVYAHGNFVFDQMWSEKTKIGVIGRYTFMMRS